MYVNAVTEIYLSLKCANPELPVINCLLSLVACLFMDFHMLLSFVLSVLLRYI